LWNGSARASLFDHLVSELLKLHSQVKAERLGGLEIDDQLETSSTAWLSRCAKIEPHRSGAQVANE
jgi:hypothetical protein